MAERTLRLEQPERQRLQVALTSLGFDTRGSDGIFGPRSREMIAAWQKARNQPATGFLNRSPAAGVGERGSAGAVKYDEQKKAEEEARTVPVATATMPASPASPPAAMAVQPSPGRLDAGDYRHDVRWIVLRWKHRYTRTVLAFRYPLKSLMVVGPSH